ncbi:MAG: bacteriocin uberolysin [Candidatus Reconcilbacillus cellulovorans]|uniref:Bacteriocin uberolysin n=1 Tax=Candidatus Reconcilbacillus cellulovorans TaxID=1906605 RepID=A0A2A6E2Q7_9BACL|nr:MAG: bacteriocin uberolysin [Candidatus Reconcilbacillus cellulovorans]
MYNLMGFLGVGKALAEQIVNVIDTVGWGAVAFSIIATILSAGSLSVASATIDFIIITVKEYIKRNLKAQAIVW